MIERTDRRFALGLQWHPETDRERGDSIAQALVARRPRGMIDADARHPAPRLARRRPRRSTAWRARQPDAPAGRVLVAEVDGELLAAISLDDGAVVADPFEPTAALVELLRARARQLEGARAPRRGAARVAARTLRRSLRCSASTAARRAPYAGGVPFAIAQVSPHPWEARTELGRYIEQVAGELAARGHRVLIVAPSESPRHASASRRALREAREDPAALLGDDGAPTLFLAGEVLSANGRGPGLPVDVARTRRGAARRCSRSTSSTSTSRSRRAPRAPRCATRARSTSGASTPRPSG